MDFYLFASDHLPWLRRNRQIVENRNDEWIISIGESLWEVRFFYSNVLAQLAELIV